MAKKQEQQEQRYAAMSPAELDDAIATADKAELAEIQKQMVGVGFSREGLKYAATLERKRDLGGKLDEEEQALVKLATVRRERAKGLEPITGAMRQRKE
jgi:hypothetical protein